MLKFIDCFPVCKDPVFFNLGVWVGDQEVVQDASRDMGAWPETGS